MRSDMDKQDDAIIKDIDDVIIKDLQRKVSWYDKKYGPYIEKRGVKNWRNLFRKPTINEWTILFMLLMAGFIAWAYMVDTEACRETMSNIKNVCLEYCDGLRQQELVNHTAIESINITGIFTADSRLDV